MVKINKINKNYIVKSDCYSVRINGSGTIRKLFFDGVNTGLTREGCEYWIDGGKHYQQEFGGVLTTMQDKNKIELTATMKTSKGRKFGGKCSAKYNFKKSSVTIESELLPATKPLSSNKYVCFYHKEYTHYSFDGEKFKEIKSGCIVDEGATSVTLKKGDKEIKIKCLSPISKMRIYKTSSMVEIKPEWVDKVMKLELCIVPSTSTTSASIPSTSQPSTPIENKVQADDEKNAGL